VFKDGLERKDAACDFQVWFHGIYIFVFFVFYVFVVFGFLALVFLYRIFLMFLTLVFSFFFA